MAIIGVRETYAGRMTGYDDKAVRKYKRAFIVEVSDANDGPLTVRLAAGVPRLFDPYVENAGLIYDLGSRCADVDVKQREDNPFLYDVECLYSSQSERPERAQDNPFLRPAMIRWDTQTYQVPVAKDLLSGKPPANSAGIPFDPPAMKDDQRLTLTIERNELAFDPTLVAPYLQDGGAMNSDPWFGFNQYCWKVMRIAANSDFENNFYFWRVTYQFSLNLSSWILELLDQGYEAFPHNEFALVKLTTKYGEALSLPKPLNGAGEELPKDGTPVYRHFSIYPELPFGALNLP